jgi:hypothetical protein
MWPDVINWQAPFLFCMDKNDITKTIKNFCMEDLLTKNSTEGTVAKAIESQTSKLPSDLFLWSSLGAMGVSLVLKIIGKKHEALFVGQWAAPFLILGLYNKLVKVKGHDQEDKSPD